MSDFETSPFSERKGNRWVWIVPSVLLHVVVLVVWLMLPEAEPRKPGERKLTIKEEQAEELQDHVEEANLEELREKVSELQSIKARMAAIREQEMLSVSEFEQDMFEEAPQDIANLLLELADIYDRVLEDYARIETAMDFYAQEAPAIRKAGEGDIVDGLRLLPKIKDYWSAFDGMGDRFEVAFYETGATLKEIEVKLEWVDDPSIAEKIEALKEPMAQSAEMHNEAWRSTPSSWKRERSFAQLTEDVEGTIATVKEFRQKEKEGKAAVAAKRAELEAEIAAAEAKLKEVQARLKAANDTFEAIDRSEDSQAWAEQRNVLREYQNEERGLQRELQNLERSLQRTQYKEDRRLAREVSQINNRFNHSLPEMPDRQILNRAVAQQEKMVETLKSFAQSLEVAE